MKFGVREICDVVLKAKGAQKIGNKVFYKHEPVIYFDTLKTSGLEGAATTVYAQGGRGNSRLVAWEGERTITFTMEDALISPAGFMILSGAGLIEAADGKPIYVHATETIAKDYGLTIDGTKDTTTGALTSVSSVTIELSKAAAKPDSENYVYVMVLDENGEVSTEPYIPSFGTTDKNETDYTKLIIDVAGDNMEPFKTAKAVLVDYYIEKKSKAQQINITPDKFGGNYYLEASTLFRTTDGVDMPAEFIIPNCKIQSNFTFTMASSGDPSSFTFTMDAFPDYTRFDPTQKVLAAIQIVVDYDDDDDAEARTETEHGYTAGV